MYIMFYNNDLCSINHQLKRILKSEIQKGFWGSAWRGVMVLQGHY
jgi:hypothetical protein